MRNFGFVEIFFLFFDLFVYLVIFLVYIKSFVKYRLIWIENFLCLFSIFYLKGIFYGYVIGVFYRNVVR